MARTKPDRRRRKRSSSTPDGASSSSSSSSRSSALLLGAVLLSLLSIVSIEDPSASFLAGNDSTAEYDSRRYLRSMDEFGGDYGGGYGGGRAMGDEFGVEDNAWHRNLRARKAKMMEPPARSMYGDAFNDGRPKTRRMQEEILNYNETWPSYEGKHRFEECVDKSVAQCQTLVDTFVTANPEHFNNQTTLFLDVRKIRELTDESYFKVVLRTDMEGERVAGIFEDGKVYYPWPWVVHEEERDIGPWDCANLETAECCQMIQNDVPDPDDLGNFLACFVEEPVGTDNNPERDDRAITIIDGKGKVIRPPIAH